MTKEELIKLLNGNLWVSGQTANSQTVMGVERAAEKIATKFFLMEAEIERLREHNTEMKWQPIETAPKDGTWVLGFYPKLGVSMMKWDRYGPYVDHWMRFGMWTPVDDPTHWMPLPLPPTQETDK